MSVFGIKPTSFTDSPKIDFHTQVKSFEGGPTLHVQNIAKRPEIFHKTTTESGVNVLSQFNPDKAAPPPSAQLGFIKNVHDYFPKQTGPGYIQEATNSGARYTEALKNTDPALFGVLGDAVWNTASVLPAVAGLTGLAALGSTVAKGGFEFLKTGVKTSAKKSSSNVDPIIAARDTAARAAESTQARAALKKRLTVFQDEVQTTMKLKRNLNGPVADAVRAAEQRPDLVLKTELLEKSVIPRYQDAVKVLERPGSELPFSIRVHSGPLDLSQAQGMLSISTNQLAFTRQQINLIDKKFPHLKDQPPKVDSFDWHW